MKKMMFLSKNWYFSVQKALIYYTVNKSHHNSFILLVISHVANFRYVANFRFLTLYLDIICTFKPLILTGSDGLHRQSIHHADQTAVLNPQHFGFQKPQRGGHDASKIL